MLIDIDFSVKGENAGHAAAPQHKWPKLTARLCGGFGHLPVSVCVQGSVQQPLHKSPDDGAYALGGAVERHREAALVGLAQAALARCGVADGAAGNLGPRHLAARAHALGGHVPPQRLSFACAQL